MEAGIVGRCSQPRQPTPNECTRRRRQRRVPEPARVGQLSGLSRSMVGGVRHAPPPQPRPRGRPCGNGCKSSRVRRRLAAAELCRREADRLDRRGFPRRLGRVGAAAARLRRRARQARERAALRVCRTASIAHRAECGPVELLDVVERMRAGQVPIAFVRGVNPAHALPKSLSFLEAFAKVPYKVSFSSYPDETTELCDVILPDLHSLESWGDAQPARGVVGLQQPTMDPVFANTRATADVLLALAKKDPAAAGRLTMKDYRSWLASRFPGGEQAFTAALVRGVAAGTIPPRATAAPAAPRRAAPTPA